ncbi:HECT domain containing 3 [Thecamonas trahens ATCC 50062]|uniref:HECT domain containing 3 n=1 Tax=Thecamonas trahens ATCC 50062 TaxID=461836 RepID=A0A0L0DJG9_THETB|nr:HECT domain containing 3 [Thecamonas trahens ATCC 50062]KNC52457.1 HECT domain containing 3 [Thecamonas trahens ATCC 50062]|eukprot:XP_013755260.1 HECT domain containing 3 [Thecamonas trahens ATCC 50062]
MFSYEESPTYDDESVHATWAAQREAETKSAPSLDHIKGEHNLRVLSGRCDNVDELYSWVRSTVAAAFAHCAADDVNKLATGMVARRSAVLAAAQHALINYIRQNCLWGAHIERPVLSCPLGGEPLPLALVSDETNAITALALAVDDTVRLDTVARTLAYLDAVVDTSFEVFRLDIGRPTSSNVYKYEISSRVVVATFSIIERWIAHDFCPPSLLARIVLHFVRLALDSRHVSLLARVVLVLRTPQLAALIDPVIASASDDLAALVNGLFNPPHRDAPIRFPTKGTSDPLLCWTHCWLNATVPAWSLQDPAVAELEVPYSADPLPLVAPFPQPGVDPLPTFSPPTNQARFGAATAPPVHEFASRPSTACTAAGFLYTHSHQGLSKIGTGHHGTELMRLYASNLHFKLAERGSLVAAGDWLLYRSPSIAPALFWVISPRSLRVVGRVLPDGSGSFATANLSAVLSPDAPDARSPVAACGNVVVVLHAAHDNPAALAAHPIQTHGLLTTWHASVVGDSPDAALDDPLTFLVLRKVGEHFVVKSVTRTPPPRSWASATDARHECNSPVIVAPGDYIGVVIPKGDSIQHDDLSADGSIVYTTAVPKDLALGTCIHLTLRRSMSFSFAASIVPSPDKPLPAIDSPLDASVLALCGLYTNGDELAIMLPPAEASPPPKGTSPHVCVGYVFSLATASESRHFVLGSPVEFPAVAYDPVDDILFSCFLCNGSVNAWGNQAHLLPRHLAPPQPAIPCLDSTAALASSLIRAIGWRSRVLRRTRSRDRSGPIVLACARELSRDAINALLDLASTAADPTDLAAALAALADNISFAADGHLIDWAVLLGPNFDVIADAARALFCAPGAPVTRDILADALPLLCHTPALAADLVCDALAADPASPIIDAFASLSRTTLLTGPILDMSRPALMRALRALVDAAVLPHAPPGPARLLAQLSATLYALGADHVVHNTLDANSRTASQEAADTSRLVDLLNWILPGYITPLMSAIAALSPSAIDLSPTSLAATLAFPAIASLTALLEHGEAELAVASAGDALASLATALGGLLDSARASLAAQGIPLDIGILPDTPCRARRRVIESKHPYLRVESRMVIDQAPAERMTIEFDSASALDSGDELQIFTRDHKTKNFDVLVSSFNADMSPPVPFVVPGEEMLLVLKTTAPQPDSDPPSKASNYGFCLVITPHDPVANVHSAREASIVRAIAHLHTRLLATLYAPRDASSASLRNLAPGAISWADAALLHGGYVTEAASDAADDLAAPLRDSQPCSSAADGYTQFVWAIARGEQVTDSSSHAVAAAARFWDAAQLALASATSSLPLDRFDPHAILRRAVLAAFLKHTALVAEAYAIGAVAEPGLAPELRMHAPKVRKRKVKLSVSVPAPVTPDAASQFSPQLAAVVQAAADVVAWAFYERRSRGEAADADTVVAGLLAKAALLLRCNPSVGADRMAGGLGSSATSSSSAIDVATPAPASAQLAGSSSVKAFLKQWKAARVSSSLLASTMAADVVLFLKADIDVPDLCARLEQRSRFARARAVALAELARYLNNSGEVDDLALEALHAFARALHRAPRAQGRLGPHMLDGIRGCSADALASVCDYMCTLLTALVPVVASTSAAALPAMLCWALHFHKADRPLILSSGILPALWHMASVEGEPGLPAVVASSLFHTLSAVALGWGLGWPRLVVVGGPAPGVYPKTAVLVTASAASSYEKDLFSLVLSSLVGAYQDWRAALKSSPAGIPFFLEPTPYNLDELTSRAPPDVDADAEATWMAVHAVPAFAAPRAGRSDADALPEGGHAGFDHDATAALVADSDRSLVCQAALVVKGRTDAELAPLIDLITDVILPTRGALAAAGTLDLVASHDPRVKAAASLYASTSPALAVDILVASADIVARERQSSGTSNSAVSALEAFLNMTLVDGSLAGSESSSRRRRGAKSRTADDSIVSPRRLMSDALVTIGNSVTTGAPVCVQQVRLRATINTLAGLARAPIAAHFLARSPWLELVLALFCDTDLSPATRAAALAVLRAVLISTSPAMLVDDVPSASAAVARAAVVLGSPDASLSPVDPEPQTHTSHVTVCELLLRTASTLASGRDTSSITAAGLLEPLLVVLREFAAASPEWCEHIVRQLRESSSNPLVMLYLLAHAPPSLAIGARVFVAPPHVISGIVVAFGYNHELLVWSPAPNDDQPNAWWVPIDLVTPEPPLRSCSPGSAALALALWNDPEVVQIVTALALAPPTPVLADMERRRAAVAAVANLVSLGAEAPDLALPALQTLLRVALIPMPLTRVYTAAELTQAATAQLWAARHAAVNAPTLLGLKIDGSPAQLTVRGVACPTAMFRNGHCLTPPTPSDLELFRSALTSCSLVSSVAPTVPSPGHSAIVLAPQADNKVAWASLATMLQAMARRQPCAIVVLLGIPLVVATITSHGPQVVAATLERVLRLHQAPPLSLHTLPPSASVDKGKAEAGDAEPVEVAPFPSAPEARNGLLASELASLAFFDPNLAYGSNQQSAAVLGAGHVPGSGVLDAMSSASKSDLFALASGAADNVRALPTSNTSSSTALNAKERAALVGALPLARLLGGLTFWSARSGVVAALRALGTLDPQAVAETLVHDDLLRLLQMVAGSYNGIGSPVDAQELQDAAAAALRVWLAGAAPEPRAVFVKSVSTLVVGHMGRAQGAEKAKSLPPTNINPNRLAFTVPKGGLGVRLSFPPGLAGSSITVHNRDGSQTTVASSEPVLIPASAGDMYVNIQRASAGLPVACLTTLPLCNELATQPTLDMVTWAVELVGDVVDVDATSRIVAGMAELVVAGEMAPALRLRILRALNSLLRDADVAGSTAVASSLLRWFPHKSWQALFSAFMESGKVRGIDGATQIPDVLGMASPFARALCEAFVALRKLRARVKTGAPNMDVPDVTGADAADEAHTEMLVSDAARPKAARKVRTHDVSSFSVSAFAPTTTMARVQASSARFSSPSPSPSPVPSLSPSAGATSDVLGCDPEQADSPSATPESPVLDYWLGLSKSAPHEGPVMFDQLVRCVALLDGLARGDEPPAEALAAARASYVEAAKDDKLDVALRVDDTLMQMEPGLVAKLASGVTRRANAGSLPGSRSVFVSSSSTTDGYAIELGKALVLRAGASGARLRIGSITIEPVRASGTPELREAFLYLVDTSECGDDSLPGIITELESAAQQGILGGAIQRMAPVVYAERFQVNQSSLVVSLRRPVTADVAVVVARTARLDNTSLELGRTRVESVWMAGRALNGHGTASCAGLVGVGAADAAAAINAVVAKHYPHATSTESTSVLGPTTTVVGELCGLNVDPIEAVVTAAEDGLAVDSDAVVWVRFVNLVALAAMQHCDVGRAGVIAHALARIKPLVLADVASRLVEAALQVSQSQTEAHGRPTLTFDRMKAAAATTLDETLFGQLVTALVDCGPELLVRRERAWRVKFVGEGASDAGGPYREVFSGACAELMSASSVVSLFVPCGNAVSGFGSNREAFVVAPGAVSDGETQALRVLGWLMGHALRSGLTLDLLLTSVFWKYMVGEEVGRADLAAMDQMCCQSLDAVREIEAQGVGPETFSDVIDDVFEVHLSDGTVRELVPGGASMPVTFERRAEWADLVEAARLHEGDAQLAVIRAGLGSVAPLTALSLLGAEQLEQRVCGVPHIDVAILKASTVYSSLSEADDVVLWLWRALESFDDAERRLFLKFVWAAPLDADEGPALYSARASGVVTGGEHDTFLPVSHTCWFQLDLPAYSSYEVLRERLEFAIRHCASIDTDFTV